MEEVETCGVSLKFYLSSPLSLSELRRFGRKLHTHITQAMDMWLEWSQRYSPHLTRLPSESADTLKFIEHKHHPKRQRRDGAPVFLGGWSIHDLWTIRYNKNRQSATSLCLPIEPPPYSGHFHFMRHPSATSQVTPMLSSTRSSTSVLRQTNRPQCHSRLLGKSGLPGLY